MSAISIYLWGLVVGFFLGWFAYGLVLAVAYNLGIVEYKGLKKDVP